MEHWVRYPFVRILFYLISGILLASYFPQLSFVGFGLLIPLIVLYLILSYIFYKSPLYYQWNYIQGFTAFLSFIIAGITAYNIHNEKNDPRHLLNITEVKSEKYLLELENVYLKSTNKFSAEARLLEIYPENKPQSCKAKVLLYIDSQRQDILIPGNKLLISSKITEIPPAYFQGGFDKKKYYANKNIFHQCYLKEKDIIGYYEGNELLKLNLFRLSTSAEKIIMNNFTSELAKQVALALLLGHKWHVESDTKEIFSSTGTIHLLAVSGLHVGIIYQILVLLLSPLSYRSKLLSFGLIALLLILYAAITGFAPSVNRAVFMFLFLRAALLINRNADIYNTLALAAFVLLLIHPFSLFDLGFQLSFLAVTSIVTFTDPITRMLQTKYRLINYLWSSVSVTIAAQILTLPVTLYYFHKLPLSMLVSNLVVVPLATPILITGLIGIILASVPYAGKLLLQVCQELIHLMIQFLQFTGRAEWATISNIRPTAGQLVLLYLIIISVIMLVKFKKKYWLYFTMAFSGALVYQTIIKTQSIMNQQKIVVARSGKELMIINIMGNSAFVYADSSTLDNKNVRNYTIQAIKDSYHISDLHTVKVKQDNSLFELNNNKFLIFPCKYVSEAHWREADYVILKTKGSNSGYLNQEKKANRPKVIFLSLSGKEEINNINLPYHNLSKQPLIIDF
ncbi:MAG: ComEC/Rec2 family competence protein [Cytophagaceae bacterium]